MAITPDCKECGAPTEPEKTALMNGVDFDGKEAVFEVVRLRCAAGHFYDHVMGEVRY